LSYNAILFGVIAGVLTFILSSFSKCFCTESEASATEGSHLHRWRDECVLIYCSVGVQTPAERIMEGSLSGRRPKRKVPQFLQRSQKYGKSTPLLFDSQFKIWTKSRRGVIDYSQWNR
jgi:hypothetical protein